MRGVRRLATVQRWYRTVAINVCLLFNVAVVFSSKYFRFLFGIKIGEAHRNVRSDYFLNFFCVSANIGTPTTPSPASKGVPPWHQRGGHTHLRPCGLSGWGPNSDDWRESLALCLLCGPVVRCANILAHRCPPPPIGNDDQARCANNFFSCSVRHPYWRRVHWCANRSGGI